MINYRPLLTALEDAGLEQWSRVLPEQIALGLCTKRFGDLPDWLAALKDMPNIQAKQVELLTKVQLGERCELTNSQFGHMTKTLQQLIPWRKGPFELFGLHLDTEWRSDWKWQRLQPHLGSLKGQRVLDVGCGNGYHCLRMLGEGAARVIGIDPSPRFVVQFYMLKQLLGQQPVDVLPLGIESLPKKLQCFDTCFSMGVLYHRRSPFDHLQELWDTLKPGGKLVLETLVIEGKLGDTLVPEGRYAKMNNVWFIPSVDTLLSWLNKMGYIEARCIDVNTTSVKEQRATDWMRFQSLPDFLNDADTSKTFEGHPAPKRAIIIAHKPD